MKVVHLTTTDFGGAYKACERIHESLLLQGINSTILVRKKMNPSTIGKKIFRGKFQELESRIGNFFNLLLSYNDVTSDYFGLNYTANKEIRESDVIILHWVNSFISYKNAERLLHLGKPVVWVLHDMWLLTGGCHYDNYCGGYSNGCKNCRRVRGWIRRKIIANNVQEKYKATHSGNLCLVGPSNWIVIEAQHSTILKGIPIEFIPNPVDINVFYKKDAIEPIRQKYGINTNKKIILFGADNPKRDSIKGEHYIYKILALLDPSKYAIFVFGGNSDVTQIACNYENRYFGFVNDERVLADLYNVADVFCAPSVQECFGYTAAEAIHCGTPVVAFDVGGHAEQILHGVNGYLAPLGDVNELARGVEFCTRDEFDFRNSNVNYSYKNIGGEYARLLHSIKKENRYKAIMR